MRIVISFLLLTGALLSVRAEWSFSQINTVSFTPVIGLDASGIPAVVYARDPYIKYGVYQDPYWSEENIYQSPYGGVGWPSLVFDQQDVPHVSFAGGSGVLCYAVMNPGDRSWTVQNFSYSYYGSWTSIALTSGGYPCISWYSFGQDLNFLAWTGAGWIHETVDQSGDNGTCNSLAVDDEGVAHIAYCRFQPFEAVMYARRESAGQWNVSVVDSSMSSQPTGTSLALNGAGIPRMSYRADGQVRYASWNGSSWAVQTVYSTDTGVGTYGTSLALDQFGYPHIAHCSAGGDSLMYSVNQGGGWLTESVYPLSAEPAGDPDLAMDQWSRPHIVFLANEGSQRLYHAFNDQPSGTGGGWASAGSGSLVAGPTPFSQSLDIAFTAPDGSNAELRVFDIAGRVVARIPSEVRGAERRAVWQPGPSLPSGQYLVALSNGETLEVRRVVFLR
jgi:hypothetical protein